MSLKGGKRATHQFGLRQRNIFDLTKKKDVSENFGIFSSSVFLKNGMHFTLLFSCFILSFLSVAPSFAISRLHFFFL